MGQGVRMIPETISLGLLLQAQGLTWVKAGKLKGRWPFLKVRTPGHGQDKGGVVGKVRYLS